MKKINTKLLLIKLKIIFYKNLYNLKQIIINFSVLIWIRICTKYPGCKKWTWSGVFWTFAYLFIAWLYLATSPYSIWELLGWVAESN